MFYIKHQSLTIFSIVFTISLFSQTKTDYLFFKKDALLISKIQLDSLSINSIEFYEFLTKEEKLSPEINQMIYSKNFQFIYKDGILESSSWSYTGLDSLGDDHFEKKTVGFKPYSFIYEDYYVYEDDKLIRIDQNTPHQKPTDFHVFKCIKPDMVLINKIPAKSFLMDHYDDIYEVLIELDKNRFLEINLY